MVSVLLTIVMFLVLITLHEFGHFIAAKISGVDVLEFSVGMGPAIFKKQGKNTLYSVRLLPIGGYCSLEGEDAESESENSFSKKGPLKRLFVVVAGAFLNILFGFLVFATVVSMGKTIATNEVTSIDARSYLADTPIRQGDKIVKIDGKKVSSYRDLSFVVSEIYDKEKTIPVEVKRGSEIIKFDTKLSLSEDRFIYEEEGVYLISRVNGEEKKTYAAYNDEQREAYSHLAGKEEENKAYLLGVGIKTEDVSIKNIIPESFYYTVFVTRMIYKGIADMIMGRVGLSEVSGPVGVAGAVSVAVSQEGYEVINYLNLLGLITINLGIFNLLPIPALDGGRLFFILIEIITRKKVPEKVERIIHATGLIILLIIAGIVLIKDIVVLM